MLSTSVDRSHPPSPPPCNSNSDDNNNNGVELDPLLKDLTEKKQFFQRSVLSLASDLKVARTRLAEQEECFAREFQIRKVSSSPYFGLSSSWLKQSRMLMLRLIFRKQKLKPRTWKRRYINCRETWMREIGSSMTTISTQQHLKDLDGLKSEVLATQAVVDDSVTLAQSAEMQILSLKEDIDGKSNFLKEQEDRINKLEEKLNLLQQDLQGKELFQIQLLDEALRIQKEITVVVLSSGTRECEIIKILEDISAKNNDNINKHLNRRDEEIIRLMDDIRFLSKQWKHKTKQLQSQLEKRQRTDQELKKRVVKLEFCLQEARAQIRKLQRMGERRDSSLKELRHQLATQQQNECSSCNKHNIWENPIFKITASISMLVLVVFARR